MPRLTRSAIGRSASANNSAGGAARPKSGRPGRPIRATASMLQHARKRFADAKKAGSPVPPRSDDQGPSAFAEEMMRKRDEFQRNGTVVLHEGGKTATLERLDHGIRVRFVASKGGASKTMTFTDNEEAGRWFNANFPQHSRI